MTSHAVDVNGRKLILFFSGRSEFSNHYPCEIVDDDGRRYSCSEQIYILKPHYHRRNKAIFFGDFEAADEIMRTRNPGQQKQIGKRVKGFKQEVWNQVSQQVMYLALTLKFSQNDNLKRILMDTGDGVLVECSKFDQRWGIGMDASHPDVLDPRKWRGQNWLGNLLMRVRKEMNQGPAPVPYKSHEDHFPPLETRPSSSSIVCSLSPHVVPSSSSSFASIASSPPKQKAKNEPEKVPFSPSFSYLSSPSKNMDQMTKKSSNLWNLANEPVRKVNREIAPKSPKRSKKRRPRNKTSYNSSPPLHSTPSPLYINLLSSSSSESSLNEVPPTEDPPQSLALSSPSLENTFTEVGVAGKNREKRKATLASFSTLTNGWLLYTQVLAKDNHYSLPQLLDESLDPENIDKRKVMRKVKKIQEEERSLVKHKGDLMKFFNTPIVMTDLCKITDSSPTTLVESVPPFSPNSALIILQHTTSQLIPNCTEKSQIIAPISSPPNTHSISFSKPNCSISQIPSAPPSPSKRHMNTFTTPKMRRTHPPASRSFPHNSFSTPVGRPNVSAIYRSRLNQRLKRLTISRDNHKNIASARLQEKKSTEDELRTLSSKFTSQEKKLNNAVAELANVKSKLSTTKKELRSYKKRLCIREDEVDLSKQIRNGLGGVLITKEDGQYTASCVKTMMELKTCGVSDRNVGPVMDKVYKSAGISMSHIPSKSTVGRTSFVAQALTNKQTHSVLSDQINRQESGQLTGMCLLSDETTKWKHKMQGYSATMINENGEKINHVIGLKAVASKDAETSLDTVMEILDEIDKSATATPAHAQVAGQFRHLVMTYMNSVMGDRASTQVKFGNIFQDYRKKILPKIRGWDTMSAKEKYLHGLFINVPCFVHCLASVTEPVIEALAKQQIKATGRQDLPLNNPTVLVLLKQLTKHFGPRSSAKYATYKNYIAYCTSNKLTPVRLPSLKGNRFNVVPAAAARIFAYKDHFLTFTDVFPTPDLKVMRRGLSDPLICAQLLVLALVDVYVTGPLWRLSKGDISVTETPKFIGELLEWVDSREDNPNLLFQGGIPQFTVPTDVHAFKLDDTMVKLLVAAKPSLLALEAAKLSMNAIAGFFRRVFAPFLPGGQYHKLLTAKGPLADRAHAALAATAANNVPSESIFGLSDWLLNRAPRSRISRIATDVLMRKNKTMSWLKSHSDGAQDKIIKECMKMGPTLEKQDKADSQKVTEKVCVKMQELAANEKVTREREQKESDRLTLQLLEYGFFHTEDDLDKFMSRDLGYAVTRNVLSLQLKFRKKVMRQPTFEANCFTINPRARQFSMTTLANKVRIAIKKDKQIPVNVFCGLDVPSSIIGKYEHIEDYGSYPCAVIACMKAAQSGPSYALIKNLCGSQKHFVVEEDFFNYYIQSGMFKKVHSRE